MDQELLRVSEVAAALQIGRTKTYELIAEGRLPVVRIGKAVRVPRRALERWIESSTVGENGVIVVLARAPGAPKGPGSGR